MSDTIGAVDTLTWLGHATVLMVTQPNAYGGGSAAITEVIEPGQSVPVTAKGVQ